MKQWLNDLSIRGKIVIGFAAALVFTAGLGLFAIHRLDAVNANAMEVKDNWLPSISILGRMAQVTERLRANQGVQLTATSDAYRQRAASLIIEQQRLYAAERRGVLQADHAR